MARVVKQLRALDGVTEIQRTRQGPNLVLSVMFFPETVRAADIIAAARQGLEADPFNPNPVFVQVANDK